MTTPHDFSVQHGRRLSPILFRHVAGEFLLALGCCLGGFMLLFLVIDVFNTLSDLVGAKAGLSDVLGYLVLRQPQNMVNILPMSILLSCGYIVGNFVRNHEVSAIRAAGVSMTTAFLPVWMVAVAFSALSFFLVEWVAPTATAKADTLIHQLTEPGFVAGARKQLAARYSRGGRDWVVEKFAENGRQEGVLITQFRPDRRVLWDIRAAAAVYQDGHWHLENGHRTEYDTTGEQPKDAGADFAALDCPELTESPDDIAGSLKSVENLSIAEMFQLMRNNPGLPASTRNGFMTAVWYRFSAPLSCLGAALLGVALSLGSHRGSRMRGFAGALLVLVLYYVVSQFFLLLGRKGLVPAAFAGTLPTLLLAVWGLRELRRRN